MSARLGIPVLLSNRQHTHPFNGPLSGTTRVSQYQKGKTNLDFTGARDSEWQWHQLGHMQVCTSLQTDNHASTSLLKVFYRPDALPAAQPTSSKHWRHKQQTTSLEKFNAAHYRLLSTTSDGMTKHVAVQTDFVVWRRGDSQCSRLFRQLVSQSHILHCLIPAQRDDGLTGRLRSRKKYPTVRATHSYHML